MRKLPVYELVIEDEEANKIEEIALVDQPAIMVNWLKFKDEKEPFKFSVNEERRIITGPVLIPEINIYRNDNGIEYFVKVSGKTVEKLCMKFAQKQFFDKINLMHTGEKPEDVFFFESWMYDKSRGIPCPTGFDVPDLTWFASAYVGNDAVWQKVKSGEIRGFSIEMFAGMIPIGQKREDWLEALNNLLITKSK